MTAQETLNEWTRAFALIHAARLEQIKMRARVATIAKLSVGDSVKRAADNMHGTVAGLRRDHVLIRWDDDGDRIPYTDAQLSAAGIAKVSPFDAEDTIPG